MDAQTQDSVCVSEKEQQLTAPPGWTKKLVPASAKFITLRKYDVVFIAPDGQEVKSKWHLNRYLKAHPEGPALSEFIWSSGEEAPIRRSTRFATKEVSEDNKITSRKKGKRNASEMDAEETENDKEKTPARKRAKKAGKSAGSDEKSAVKDAADVPENDEVMHEAVACDNEASQDAAPCDEVQKDESNDENFVEVEASKEAVTEKATNEGLDKQVEGEHEEIQAKVVEVKESFTDNGIHRENELNAGHETGTLVAPSDELKVEEVAISEKPPEHADDKETGTLVAPSDELKVSEKPPEQADDKVMELKEHLDQKFEENEDVSCKVTVVTSVVEELVEGNDKPLDPLMQKEEQERLIHIQNSPLKGEHIKEKSPSEFSSSSVPVSAANQ